MGKKNKNNKKNKTRELLFSIHLKDCEVQYFRGSGKGGQKRNKTSSAVRIKHLPSKSFGQCESFREQSRNREEAFVRLFNKDTMQKWLEVEGKKKMGYEDQLKQEIEKKVDRQMKDILLEVWEDGEWVAIKDL